MLGDGRTTNSCWPQFLITRQVEKTDRHLSDSTTSKGILGPSNLLAYNEQVLTEGSRKASYLEVTGELCG